MKVKEIKAINGPYEPTGNGVELAIEACLYDRELGQTEANSSIVVVLENGEEKEIAVGGHILGNAYEAAEIAHDLGIEHDSSICGSCASESEESERCADAILN